MSSQTIDEIINKFRDDLEVLGIEKGSLIMVHSAFRPLRPMMNSPETVIKALLLTVGPEGNLLMPALSYLQQPPTIHNTLKTPANIGAIPECFRQYPGVIRSLHPTHSVCGYGSEVEELFKNHFQDTTPCGLNSPFNRMIEKKAKIVMLGCGLRPNTIMHALEEYVNPPYLFGPKKIYTITKNDGTVIRKEYLTHNFSGWVQRYDRITQLPGYDKFVKTGLVCQVKTQVIDSVWLKNSVIQKLKDNPLFFVEKKETDERIHSNLYR